MSDTLLHDVERHVHNRAETAASLTVEAVHESSFANRHGHRFVHLETYLSGTLRGWVYTGGPVAKLTEDDYGYLYDAPQITAPQESFSLSNLTDEVRHRSYDLQLGSVEDHLQDLHPATGEFRAADGAGVDLFLPQDRADWNGKLFIVQRGRGIYIPLRAMVAGGPHDLVTLGLGRNEYLELMLDLGYAAAWLRKDADAAGRGISFARTDDGRTFRTTFGPNVGLATSLVEYCQREVERRLGEPPARTYYYGHSGGGVTGRLINVTPGANVGPAGGRLIDGFVISDSGGGRHLPVAVDGSGRDVLLADDAAREAFAPQIDVTRALYNVESYRQLKLENARLLRAKGLGHRHRHYEVAGTSHFDAGQAQEPGSRNYLDLGGFVEALVLALDAWVERGVEPPPDGVDETGAGAPVELPEVAVPLGVFHAGHSAFRGNDAAMRTMFAPFDGKTREPVDSDTGRFVDMNGNGVRDLREDLPTAWRRLGLLRAGEAFDEAGYRGRVSRAARALVERRLLPERVADWYDRTAADRLHSSGVTW